MKKSVGWQILCTHLLNVNLAGITVAGTGEAHGLMCARNIANLLYHLNMPSANISEERRVAHSQ